MRNFWTIIALICAVFVTSCSSPEGKANDFAKELKELSGTDKAKKIDGVVKAREKYEKALSAKQRESYDAAWLAAIEKDAKDIAIAVVKAVKSCNVAKAQELEKKVADYKKGLNAERGEVAKFDEVFNNYINDPDEGLKKANMEKFNEAVYIWFHPLEKLVYIKEELVEVVPTVSEASVETVTEQ